MHQNTKRHLFVWSKFSLDEISKLCLAGPPKGFCLSLEAAFGLRFLMFPWQVNGVCPLRRRTKSWMNAARRHQQGAGDDWDLPTFWGMWCLELHLIKLVKLCEVLFFQENRDLGFSDRPWVFSCIKETWDCTIQNFVSFKCFFYTCTEIRAATNLTNLRSMVV